MEDKTKTIYLDPLEMIDFLYVEPIVNQNNIPYEEGKSVVEHITFDKNVDHQYKITRKCNHDGTIMFTFHLIKEALYSLVTKTSYYEQNKPNELELKNIKYTIGEIELNSTFGEVELHGHKRFGQTDIISIPVKCEYIYW